MKRFQKVLVIAMLLIVGIEQAIQPVNVLALEDNIRQFYVTNDITTFDPNDCILSLYDKGGVQLKGDSIIEKILNFFMSRPDGLTLAQAAGIVGNMAQESPHGVDEKTGVNSPNPAVEEGGALVPDDYKPKDGTGFGLVQWTWTSRQQPLVDLVAEGGPMAGRKITDLEVQLTYVWQELNSPTYSKTLEALKAAARPTEAAIIVHGPPYPGYEASADPPDKVRDVRGGNAEKVFNRYKDAPDLSQGDDNKGNMASTSTGAPAVKSDVPACDESFTGGKFAETLLNYAWPTHKGNVIEATEGYKTAVQRAISESRYRGGTIYPGIDCGGFVTLLVTDSGFEPGYNYGGKLSDGAGNTTQQKAWLDKHWYHLTDEEVADINNREQGDVAINGTHTYIYVDTVLKEQGKFDSEIASASWDERAPMAGTEGATDSNFEWYSKTPKNKGLGSPNKSLEKNL